MLAAAAGGAALFLNQLEGPTAKRLDVVTVAPQEIDQAMRGLRRDVELLGDLVNARARRPRQPREAGGADLP